MELTIRKLTPLNSLFRSFSGKSLKLNLNPDFSQKFQGLYTLRADKKNLGTPIQTLASPKARALPRQSISFISIKSAEFY